MTRLLAFLSLFLFSVLSLYADEISRDVMQAIYDEVRTPYKYGLVVAPPDNYHKIDCPTVFREGDKWLMTYVVYNGKDGTDGRGYETWLAESDDLLTWRTLGRLLSYRDDGWDMNQRGGFPALVDWTWGGDYHIGTYKGRHWMTYIGGHGTGYEAVKEPLNIGMAWTKDDVTTAHEWQTALKPMLSIADRDAQWWEQLVQYKSTVYDDPSRSLGKRFVMFYNAGGINPANNLKAERIGIALSNDLKHWQRYAGNPVFANEVPGIITGDAQIAQFTIHNSQFSIPNSQFSTLYVMFYFMAYNPDRPYNAYNTFAVSRDLIHWQPWDGPDLIWPTKKYDEMFAHKSYVLKHDGVVYHFYCAVNNDGQRGIALATSVPAGRSAVRFPDPEPAGHRIVTSLNDNWQCQILNSPLGRRTLATNGTQEFSIHNSQFTIHNSQFTIPHNLDDYYGYRQLRHGNLHGSALYSRTFRSDKLPGKRYFLQFEGVGTYATVTLNGHEYPRELVGRTVWTLDITDALRSGDNTLDVRVDHPAMQTESPWVCGGCSSEWGFSEGSQPFGIFRPVTLIATDAVRIEPFGVHIWNNAACDSIFIDTEIRNYTDTPQTIELINKFTQKSGKQVFRDATTVALQPNETKTLHLATPIDDPHRWSLDDPYLYKLATIVKRDGKVIDDLATPFGIRSLQWPHSQFTILNSQFSTLNSQFLLNGAPVFINGTSEYEHLLGASHAFSHEQIASRIKQVRNASFNALREAHQPHNLYYQQLLDEQGLLFWSQFSAHIWYDTPQFRDNFKRLLVRWIKERRNSPSIILWGLQNESVLPRDFAEECSDIIRSLDPTASTMRLITTCNGGEGTDWNVVQNWSGTYGGNPDNYGHELSQPDQLLNGEYGAWRTLDLHGTDKYSEESFTALLQLKARLAEHAADSVCGHFQWLLTSHDNPGRKQPDGAYRRIDKIGPINYKGLLTIWEEPTMAYYMYANLIPDSLFTNHNSQFTILNSPLGRRTLATNGTQEFTNHNSQFPILNSQFSILNSQFPILNSQFSILNSPSVFRVNCGGDAYTDSQGQLWQADDSIVSHSWGQDFGLNPYQASQRHLALDIPSTTDPELFQFFRFGRHRLWYDIPVPDDSLYTIDLYFMEPWHGRYDTSETADYEGLRIFDVAVNDSLVIDDLDPWAEAGYLHPFRRTVTARARNHNLHISFPEVKAGQAVICAIAVTPNSQFTIHNSQFTIHNSPLGRRTLATNGTQEFTNSQFSIPNSQFPWHALDSDTIAKLPEEELPHDVDTRPATVYTPQSAKSLTRFLVTTGLGQEYALRFHYKNTTGQPVTARLTVVDAKNATLIDRDITFPPTPNKFKILSTTTGTQINAGTYQVILHADNLEFQSLEVQ